MFIGNIVFKNMYLILYKNAVTTYICCNHLERTNCYVSNKPMYALEISLEEFNKC